MYINYMIGIPNIYIYIYAVNNWFKNLISLQELNQLNSKCVTVWVSLVSLDCWSKFPAPDFCRMRNCRRKLKQCGAFLVALFSKATPANYNCNGMFGIRPSRKPQVNCKETAWPSTKRSSVGQHLLLHILELAEIDVDSPHGNLHRAENNAYWGNCYLTCHPTNLCLSSPTPFQRIRNQLVQMTMANPNSNYSGLYCSPSV